MRLFQHHRPLADIIDSLAKADREGRLRERIRYLCRTQLLIIDEIGYVTLGGAAGNLFFQLVNARYERGAMILTSNRGFAEWGQVFGDPVIATALLDRLLHHAVVVHIEGSSRRYRSFEERLISEETLDELQQAGTLPIAVEPDFERFIVGRRTLLDARLAAVDARAKDGLLPDVSIERGVLRIAPVSH